MHPVAELFQGAARLVGRPLARGIDQFVGKAVLVERPPHSLSVACRP